MLHQKVSIFRDEFLQKNTIAIDEDVILKDQCSKKSIVWLDYLSKKHNINTQHDLNVSKKKFIIGNETLKIDGFYENAVFQF